MELLVAGRFAPGPSLGGTDVATAGYAEHLRVPALSVGTYSIPAGGTDGQQPHTEDEIYVVVSGRGQFTGGGQTVAVQPGSVIYVPRREEHRFHDVDEDLAVIVFFAPAEGSTGS
jgi:mannose-6-phosphate isomerase-like protein (cupin superfamily)